ncbi:lysine exporter protein [Deinococcus aerius]|uniref:Lysine exporter protein n=2 Tax=Deinococcus TaxID=1298 RepID=A0A2I9DF57_9DEIO|nr:MULTISPECIES: LysE family transporter [Deinococcus]MBB5293881.1 L-lysine exporter family protein LysE/ArgO [Deinococcus metallilatus]QBY07173.1 amino acid transporter [Deinococcus metallilatus]RXJ14645.1 amino acid transporter [Deinococcus metallilatus]TLK30765.1 amino acid transporter [Deinococcus metallilatus]GBF04658.1 lysine exporter protein [Deinococcus aerius]
MAEFFPAALVQGFGVSAAHLIGVSALNAFVLRQALHRHHPLVAGSAGVLADMLFITLGTTGLGALLARLPLLAPVAAWGGAAFLFWHGWKAFRAVRSPNVIDTRTPRRELGGPRQVAATALGLTLLNPHPYVDSVVLFGALSTPLPPLGRTLFALGAVSASLAWYALLAFGGVRLAPLFRSPRAWRWLDVLVGTLLWTFALSLMWRALHGGLLDHG